MFLLVMLKPVISLQLLSFILVVTVCDSFFLEKNSQKQEHSVAGTNSIADISDTCEEL